MTLMMLLLVLTASFTAEAQRTFGPPEIVDADASYPEGPQLTEDGVLVAEMPRDRIALVPLAVGAQKTRKVWSQAGCGPTSIKRIPSGGFWILCHLGGRIERVDSEFHHIKTIESASNGVRIEWPNDASVDSKGNLWFTPSGLFSLEAPAEGRVLFINEKTNEAREAASGIRYSNGILVQEAQHRALVSEHLNRRVLSFPLKAPGRLGKPKTFFDFKNAPIEGGYSLSGPDGIGAFNNGDLLVADYGNGRVLILSTKGKYLGALRSKYPFVTNFAIDEVGGAVYVVSSQFNQPPSYHGVVERFPIVIGPRAKGAK